MKIIDVQVGDMVEVIKVPKKYRRWCKKGNIYPVIGLRADKVEIKLSNSAHAYNSILINPSLLIPSK